MKLIILFFMLHFSAVSSADKLISCNDGDTCKIQSKKGVVNVRLWGIDAPEFQQEYAIESRDYLVKLLADKDLKLECLGKSYHRKVCKISFDGKNASEEMVKAGWAWDYSQFSLKLFKNTELEARKNKLGIWKSEKTISPFCTRHSEAKACVKLKNLYQP